MEYSSVVFIFYFLPIFLAGYYLLPKTWTKNLLLFVFSLVFYFWGGGKFVILLLSIGFFSWFFSLLIAKTQFKRGFLIVTVLVFVGILVYNKYLGFIIDNLVYLGARGFPKLELLTTLGVSFFTFQAISYTIDVYRKNNRFERNPLYVMLYITMFPQLISGPLTRYWQMEQQLKYRRFDFQRFSEGIRRFVIGLGKKVLIANSLSYLVNQIVGMEPCLISPLVAWVGMIAFAVQIFFDFSGYTDMAIGVGKMLGFDLPENFNYPYISKSITEFWRRWHISFSSWIRDYIFTPLATNLRYWGHAGIFISLMVTFLVCGLWHGPTWNYLLWGLVQGLFLGLEQLFLLKFLKRLKGFAVVYTLVIIVSCSVLFRTENLHQAINYYAAMFAPSASSVLGLDSFFMNEHIVVLLLGILFCIPISLPARFKTGTMGHVVQIVDKVFLLIVLLFSVMNLVAETYSPFIYFKF
ncbi:MAG: MBOAT family O-acyltransferase [Bacteroidota bacterium]